MADCSGQACGADGQWGDPLFFVTEPAHFAAPMRRLAAEDLTPDFTWLPSDG
jgi:hypothetical protein